MFPRILPCLLQRSEPRWGAKPCTLRSQCTRHSSSQTTPSCRPSTLSPLTSCRGCTASALCKPCTWTTGLLVTHTSKGWGRPSQRWQPPRVWSIPGFPSQRYPSQPQPSFSIQSKPALRTASPRCTKTGRGLTLPTWPSPPLKRIRRKLRIWRSWQPSPSWASCPPTENPPGAGSHPRLKRNLFASSAAGISPSPTTSSSTRGPTQTSGHILVTFATRLSEDKIISETTGKIVKINK